VYPYPVLDQNNVQCQNNLKRNLKDYKKYIYRSYNLSNEINLININNDNNLFFNNFIIINKL
jgi:hypothetical protein